MPKSATLCLLAVILHAHLSLYASAEVIRLKSGRTIEGPVLEKTDTFIKVDINGVSIAFYNDEIERVEAQAKESGKSPEEVYKASVPGVVYIRVKKDGEYYAGSGFIVDPAGIVVTNFHVVVKAQEIQVEFQDGRTFPVEGIIDYDAVRDLCVLKIPADRLTTLSLADSDRLSPGQNVLVIGSPAGVRFSSSEGVYSGWRRFCGLNHLQMTAPIVPGMSGGPVLDEYGKVIGVATFKRMATTNNTFAIPINEVKKYINHQTKLSIAEFNKGISRAYEFFHLGQESYFKDDLTAAVSYLEKAVQAEPDYLEAWYGLGETYLAAGRMDDALRTWTMIVEKDPDNVEAHVNLGMVYFERKMYDEAVKECEAAIQLDPQSEEAYDNLGVIYGRQKRYDQAMAAHKKALGINEFYARAHYNLATVYYNIQDQAKAIEHCDRALQLDYDVPAEFRKMLEPYRRK